MKRDDYIEAYNPKRSDIPVPGFIWVTCRGAFQGKGITRNDSFEKLVDIMFGYFHNIQWKKRGDCRMKLLGHKDVVQVLVPWSYKFVPYEGDELYQSMLPYISDLTGEIRWDKEAFPDLNDLVKFVREGYGYND
jgi:hypothetical protein